MQLSQDSNAALTFHPATLTLQLLSGSASDGCLKSFQNIASQRFLKKRPGSYLYGKGRSMNYRRWLTGLQVGKPEEVSIPRAGPSALVSGCASHKGTAGPSEDPGHGAERPDPFSVQRMKRCRWTLLAVTEKQCARLSQGWLRKYWRTASSLGKEVFCCCCCC